MHCEVCIQSYFTWLPITYNQSLLIIILLFDLSDWKIEYGNKLIRYSHYPSVTHFPVILVIRLAKLWWNPSRTLKISPMTKQLSLPYIIPECATTLYIIPWYRTVYTVFVNTLKTTPHHLHAFYKLWNNSEQSLFWLKCTVSSGTFL